MGNHNATCNVSVYPAAVAWSTPYAPRTAIPGTSKVPIYPGADGIVVARFTMPFININAKKDTLKLKACMTNQYLPVSRSQMMTDVKKTISTLNGERNEASPSKNLFMMPMIFVCIRFGVMRSMTLSPVFAVTCGYIAASKKIASAPRNTPVPITATC